MIISISDLADIIQIILNFAIIGFMILIAVKSNGLQKYFIEREETFRVMPFLRIFGAAPTDDGFIVMSIKNVGKGYASDIKLNIAIDSWLSNGNSKSTPATSKDLPPNLDNNFNLIDTITTKITKQDVLDDCNGEYVVWGTMINELGNEVEIKKIYVAARPEDLNR